MGFGGKEKKGICLTSQEISHMVRRLDIGYFPTDRVIEPGTVIRGREGGGGVEMWYS